MSRKDSKSLFILFIFLFVCLSSVYGGDYAPNGIAYVLLNEDFGSSRAGVYRMNNPSGTPYSPWKVFQNISSAKGLSASQEKITSVYLLSPGTTGSYATCTAGILPSGVTFEPDSKIYLKVARPIDGEAGSGYSLGKLAHSTSYWKTNYNISGYGKYPIAVQFGGPNGVKYMDAKGNPRGTPIWTGSGNCIPHPTDPNKIILPSHYGAVAYYLYGTRNSDYAGLPMDGTAGRPTYTYNLASKMGNYNDNLTKHNAECPYRNYSTTSSTYKTHGPYTGTIQWGHRCNADQYFGCVVKRIYQERTRDLDLKVGKDYTNVNTWTSGKTADAGMSTSTNPRGNGILQTKDYKIIEFLGKWCGDDCIPGSGIDRGDTEGLFSNINVLTTTTGNAYGFNPSGVPAGAGTASMLRAVRSSGPVSINVTNFANFKNKTYLTGKGTVNQLKNIGVSSDFSDSATYDHIYGSFADRFVVQDSWWGLGGIAYEYNVGSKAVVKLDYMNETNPSPEPVGTLDGDIDAIGIDGDAYFYALKSEASPSKSDVKKPGLSANLTKGTYYYTIGGESSVPIVVSGWKRNVDSGETSTTINVAEGSQINGDYRIVKLKRKVYKHLYRYKQAEGNLAVGSGSDYDRGKLFAGYDIWKNEIVYKNGTNKWKNTNFTEDNTELKTSNLKAELAIVNVADSPVTIPGSTKKYIMVTNKSNFYSGSGKIAEDSKLDFKVEGYKPGYPTKSFKSVGSFGSYEDVRINTILASDGSMNHDEDGNGLKSGFPSNMFEAKNYYTTVYWYIYQVENTSAVNIIPSCAAKVVRKCVDNISRNSFGYPTCTFSHQFKDPGRYIVQAKIVYNYFNNFGTANRPKDLKHSTETKYTEPFLINVYSNDLRLDTTTSYITNVKLSLNNKANSYHSIPIPTSGTYSGKSYSGYFYDVPEGKEKYSNPKFGDLTISFDAQFYYEQFASDTRRFNTYDGIGVWDYKYYAEYLYPKVKSSGVSGVTIPSGFSGHVYNYLSNSAVSSCYDKNVYNPGKAKPIPAAGVAYTFSSGTKVDGDPSTNDKKFIQYALYLRDVEPQNTNPLSCPKERGKKIIKQGDFTSATFKNIGTRKYNVSLTLNNIASIINTPRDPNSYVLDLEIYYPRITWLDNALGGSDGQIYYSSVVPYNPDRGMAPVHVLTDLTTTSPTANTFNQSSLSPLMTTGGVSAPKPELTLSVRDYKKPKFEDKSVDLVLPKFESTGDKPAGGIFNYKISDNNPFMQLKKITGSSRPISLTPNTPGNISKDLTKLYLQRPKNYSSPNLNNYSDADSNKTYVACSGVRYAKIEPIDSTLNITSQWYTDDKWEIIASYTNIFSATSVANSLGGLNLSGTNQDGATIGSNKIPDYTMQKIKRNNIKTENWVGNLNYAIYGVVYDGLGCDGTDKYDGCLHYIYDETLKGNGEYPNLSLSASEKDTKDGLIDKGRGGIYLTRLDNDPPSIAVEIVSQNDNTKWNVELIEGVNDRVSFGKTKDDLAKSMLTLSSCELISGNNIIATSTVYIDGTTNVYSEKVGEEPKTHTNAKPTAGITGYRATCPRQLSYKKSSRLLINVDIIDNCGYKPLGEAWIEVKYGDDELIPKTSIKLDASHSENGIIKSDFANQPRQAFIVDLPSHIVDGRLVTIDVYAKDESGNERQLTINGSMNETSFDARVIEHKENKQ